jgi:DNA-binding transcriptional LysR family regulator
MGRYVTQFEARHPHAKVHIDYVHPNQVHEKVQEGTVDLGLVSFPGRSRDLTVLPWREEEMVVACLPSHPLAGCAALPPARLDGQKFVAFARDLVIRREIDRFLREQHVAVDVVLEFDNIESMKKGIEVSGGLALLPEPTLRQEQRAGTLRAMHLEGCRLVRPLGIIHRRRQPPCSTALAFAGLLRSAEEHSAPGTQGNGAAAGTTSPDSLNGARTKRTARSKRTVP